MNNRIPGFFFFLFISFFTLLSFSCTRINDTTDLGDDLIPTVDNVTTFDTIINVESYNDTFTIGNIDKLLNDSTRSFKSGLHYAGRITSDPLFGASDASIFLELKPPSFKYYFENHSDSLFIDSVVLVLDYLETFGDTNALQTFRVYELNNVNSNLFKADSNYLLRVNGFTYNQYPPLGVKTFAPNILNDSIKAFRDTTKNQLRIRLANSFGTRLLQYDSSATGAYLNDSAFKSYFKGFAVVSEGGGNALMGFNLIGANTKLALYYRYKNVPRQDTTVRYFVFNPVLSGNANYIKRNYTGSPANLAFGGIIPDDLVYLQNSPGTFARIKIPGLGSVTNRVIHRAELIVEQIYHPSNDIFYRPEQMMLDVLDTALKNYRYVPYDFRLLDDGAPNFVAFGTIGRQTVDGSGNPIRIWKFNISRYIQNTLTKVEPVREFRLLTPYIMYDIYKPNPNVVGEFVPLGINSAPARGRVMVAGGNYSTDPNRRMRLRLVYSKL